MKPFMRVGIVALVVLVCGGVAIGGSFNDSILLTKNDKHYSRQEADDIDLEKTLVKVSPYRGKRPGYCTSEYEVWCQEKCGNASASAPSGSDRWGWQCTPGKEKKCRICGYLSDE